MEGNQKKYWQSIRGLCILAVVLIHSFIGFNYVNGDIPFIFVRQIINFAVATFVFMAGYFVNPEKIMAKDFQYKNWLIYRGGRLLIPFTIWSIFYSCVSILQAIHKQQEINWFGVVCRFIIGKSATPFYYIVVLLQLTIITPWLVKTIKKRGSLEKLLWVITPAYLVYIYIFNFQCGKSPMFYEVLFPAWFGFYYLGVQVKCGRTVRGSISWLTVAFIYSFFEALFLRYFGLSRGFYTSQINIGSFLYSLALICLIINYQDKTCCFLSRVGDCSYGIFYIHMFVLFFAGKVVDFIGVTDIWLAYWGIRFMITSIVSFVIVRGTQIVLGKHKQLLRWIGFI